MKYPIFRLFVLSFALSGALNLASNICRADEDDIRADVFSTEDRCHPSCGSTDPCNCIPSDCTEERKAAGCSN